MANTSFASDAVSIHSIVSDSVWNITDLLGSEAPETSLSAVQTPSMIMQKDLRLDLFIASSSIIILSLIIIIGVVSCFILCNEERQLMQDVTLDSPLRESYEQMIRQARNKIRYQELHKNGFDGQREKNPSKETYINPRRLLRHKQRERNLTTVLEEDVEDHQHLREAKRGLDDLGLQTFNLIQSQIQAMCTPNSEGRRRDRSSEVEPAAQGNRQTTLANELDEENLVETELVEEFNENEVDGDLEPPEDDESQYHNCDQCLLEKLLEQQQSFCIECLKEENFPFLTQQDWTQNQMVPADVIAHHRNSGTPDDAIGERLNLPSSRPEASSHSTSRSFSPRQLKAEFLRPHIDLDQIELSVEVDSAGSPMHEEKCGKKRAKRTFNVKQKRQFFESLALQD